jgi:hypothetical protein
MGISFKLHQVKHCPLLMTQAQTASFNYIKILILELTGCYRELGSAGSKCFNCMIKESVM